MDGTSPRYAIGCRTACKTVTIAAINQLGSNSSICRVSRASRVAASCVDVLLQHNLLRGAGKAHRRQPVAVGERPGAGPAINPLMPQKRKRRPRGLAAVANATTI
jgi:hypothetical protein